MRTVLLIVLFSVVSSATAQQPTGRIFRYTVVRDTTVSPAAVVEITFTLELDGRPATIGLRGADLTRPLAVQVDTVTARAKRLYEELTRPTSVPVPFPPPEEVRNTLNVQFFLK